MKKRYKKCENCSHLNSHRAKFCNSCDNILSIWRKERREEILFTKIIRLEKLLGYDYTTSNRKILNSGL